jgi:hypothetical protein
MEQKKFKNFSKNSYKCKSCNSLDDKLVFSNNFFDRNIDVSMVFTKEYVKKIDYGVKILEIGSYEGKSTIWMLQNLCSMHTDGLLISIDPYPIKDSRDISKIFTHNIERSGFADRVIQYIDYSINVLPKLECNFFDIIYVDGSQLESDIMSDLIFSHQLLKLGGLLIFNNVEKVIETFLNKFQSCYDILLKENQVVLQKV